MTRSDISRRDSEANGVATDPLAAALRYAHRGFKSFPLHNPVAPHRVGFGSDAITRCSCGHSDCKNPGKHPRTAHGHRDATCDERVIRDWWTRWPDANVGIATGAVSGLFVVDVDPRNGGIETLKALEAEHGRLTRGAFVITGGGGVHFYFRYPKDALIAGRANALGLGIDIKADGGYVVAPPSLHISGRRYRWA